MPTTDDDHPSRSGRRPRRPTAARSWPRARPGWSTGVARLGAAWVVRAVTGLVDAWGELDAAGAGRRWRPRPPRAPGPRPGSCRAAWPCSRSTPPRSGPPRSRSSGRCAARRPRCCGPRASPRWCAIPSRSAPFPTTSTGSSCKTRPSWATTSSAARCSRGAWARPRCCARGPPETTLRAPLKRRRSKQSCHNRPGRNRFLPGEGRDSTRSGEN